MSPAERIANLDRALGRAGQSVQIQRPGGAVNNPTVFSATADCRAQVVASGVGTSAITVSPTDLLNSPTWPEQDAPAIGDALLPRKTDKIFVNGLQRTIQNVHPRYIDDVLIRVDIEAAA
jgi:hypothetical protein